MTTINYQTNEQGVNLGIAHGIPGIMLFLRKLYLKNIKKDIISDMIIKATNYLLLQKHSLITNNSFFYFSIGPVSGFDSKLAWCYGDISVGYALLMVSTLNGIENQYIKEIALDILINTTNRPYETIHSGLCHGTAGIAHFYNRIYNHTSELKFRNASLYWCNETLKMAKHENDYAGYRVPYYFDESQKDICETENLSLLAGISGIGLSLLSAIYPIEPSWDTCLLLS